MYSKSLWSPLWTINVALYYFKWIKSTILFKKQIIVCIQNDTHSFVVITGGSAGRAPAAVSRGRVSLLTDSYAADPDLYVCRRDAVKWQRQHQLPLGCRWIRCAHAGTAGAGESAGENKFNPRRQTATSGQIPPIYNYSRIVGDEDSDVTTGGTPMDWTRCKFRAHPITGRRALWTNVGRSVSRNLSVATKFNIVAHRI
jgi:hypothetical protein